MSAVLERVDPLVELARIDAALDALAAMDSSGLCDEVLLDYGREKERLRRRLASSDHGLVQEIEARELPAGQCVSTVSFLRGLLRLDAHEASARVKAAHAAGPRRALTGEPLPAVFPEVAAAQAAGEICARHAAIVVDTIDKLPDEVQAAHGEQIEADLVGYAKRFDPHQLARIAKRLRYCYDQDGKFNEVDYRTKVRELSITQRPDGSSSIKAEATAELTELLLLHLDAFARPKPEVDGVKDPRTAGQRRHDALLEALKLNVRARQLPSVAGVTATIVLTMSAEDFEQRKGLAHSGHGALVPVPEAIRMTGGEYRLMNVVIDNTKAITAYSSTARLFTENQRLALAAVDRGCTFPNCPAPPGWCEIDQQRDERSREEPDAARPKGACVAPTGAIRSADRPAGPGGDPMRRINTAAWIPPRWIDPNQEPRYNHLHDTEPP